MERRPARRSRRAGPRPRRAGSARPCRSSDRAARAGPRAARCTRRCRPRLPPRRAERRRPSAARTPARRLRPARRAAAPAGRRRARAAWGAWRLLRFVRVVYPVAQMPRAERRPHTLPESIQRILCISAHPDDNEFTVAGSVARWAREGRDVVFCLVTSGGSGTNEHTPDNTGLIPIRERESWDAAKILGVKDLVFLGYQDGVVETTIGLRRDLTRVIRRSRPDVVVCSDPTVHYYGNEYMNHPDHRAVASAALDAVFPSAETGAIFPELIAEGLAPHKVKQVFLAGSLDPDVFVDIAATLAAKCRALKAHRSQ